MGTSTAFLTELETQRSSAVRELLAAQADGDEGAAAVAVARLQDLDELLSRNRGSDELLSPGPMRQLSPAC